MATVAAMAQPVVQPLRPQDYTPVDQAKQPTDRAEPASLPDPEIDLPEDTQPLVDNLQAVVFRADPDAVLPQNAKGEGVDTSALPLLDNDAFRATIQPHLGRPLTWQVIGEMVKTTIMYYRSQGRPVVDVIVPEQEVTNGVLQLLVVEGRLGRIEVKGNEYFSDESIRSKVRMEPGDPIRASRLLADVDYLNTNPFRYVRPVLGPGEEVGQTDLTLQTNDRWPYRIYWGWEDTGSRATRLDRYLYGVNMGNVGGKDIELGYQFATNHRWDEIGVHSAYLRLPLPNRDTFAMYGSLACYDARHDGVDFRGNSWQISPRYIKTLPTWNSYRHEIQFGFDFKRTTNDLKFLHFLELYEGTVDTTQFVFEYSGSWRDTAGTTSFTSSSFWQPGPWSSKGQQSDYIQTRAGTDSDYVYTNLSLERIWYLPLDFEFVNRFIGQLAGSRLIATEQLGLGGYNTVRGYDEREVNTDAGVMVSLELRTPRVKLGRLFNRPDMANRIQFLTFWDYGQGHNRGTFAGEDQNIELQSVGVGMRYWVGNYLSFRMDYGHRLDEPDFSTFNDQGRFHFGLLVAY
jgi:hemolysin activation/secretion protein